MFTSFVKLLIIYILFAARDADEKERWIDALEETILRHSQTAKVLYSIYLFKNLMFVYAYVCILQYLNQHFIFFISAGSCQEVCLPQWTLTRSWLKQMRTYRFL
jgi:hypothetical protein